MPKVSVFIPVYNTEKYVGQAIESILNQTYKDFELIILDDCSTDKTYEIAQSYSKKDTRIKLYRNDNNLGMMPNWIKGINLCNGKYFGKLDADDYWMPETIETSVKILDENPKVGLVCGKYKLVDEKGKITDTSVPEFFLNKELNILELVNLGPRDMLKYNVLRQGIGLMRRSVFEELGTFKLFDSADTEMWYRIGCNYEIFCVNKVLQHHRIWPESYMRTKVDVNEYRLNNNLFITRNYIIDYCYERGKIEKNNYLKFKKENKFIFNSFLIYYYRIKRNYLKMLKYLFENLVINFKKSLIENLHIDRLIKR